MSEDLVQTEGVEFGRYRYIRLGATTLSALSKSGYLSSSVPEESKGRKPDGLIVLPGGTVKAVVEVKTPKELTSAKIPNVIKKYSPIAVAANTNLLIITDGNKTLWINPHTGSSIQQDGVAISTPFLPLEIEGGKLSFEHISELNELIDQCAHQIGPTNDFLKPPVYLNPAPLAEAVWQKIWVTTGKEPEKCLYNVVEIFVFRFLSDTGVLTGLHSFDHVMGMLSSNPQSNRDALEHYAKIVRHRIRTLFPKGVDGTTVINGTIFVNENGAPNYSQAALFCTVLRAFQEFTNINGSMRNIDRQFKTRLYETFLRQSAGVKALGQYFTPRNVVQAVVQMSNAGSLPDGARICDPFCGVGGFILETIAENPKIFSSFKPVNGKVSPQVTLKGYDKGSDEKEDERTIILAKANMLIYFSELLGVYNDPKYLREFSEQAFNKVFELLRDGLGTFSKVHDEPYDLILTNPPYVTSGSRALRDVIDAEGLSEHYPPVGRGTEALAIRWIINNLKEGGKALVIVPDGLMNQSAVLQSIKEECDVCSIVALPSRTFFSTPKKTYILEIKKRFQGEKVNNDPVFTYLVSEIGETRDARRLIIEANDLTAMVKQYRYFMVDKVNFSTTDLRCKVIDWEEFNKMDQWLIERRWTLDERKALGMVEERSQTDEEGFRIMLDEVVTELQTLLYDMNQ